jgi:putative ABC transport system permease protein
MSVKSILNRRLTTVLTLLSIGMSVALLFGVERIRQGAWQSFESTLSGADLIVGARGGSVQLLLYSVFRIGEATNNMSWQSFEKYRDDERVLWAIPLSLGDSHRGFRVLGTDDAYFQHYRYGKKQVLEFAEGNPFVDVYDAVIGSEVAKALKYKVGDKIVLSHGVSSTSFQEHNDKPFTVVGILKSTATPIDRTVHVSLAGIEAIHLGWESGAPPTDGEEVSADEAGRMDLRPSQITAAIIGLKSKMSIFRLQRDVNDDVDEALMAILPGVTFQQLWRTVNVAEVALRVVSIFVVITGLLGMVTSILASLNERRREMAILRALGAKPQHIFLLLATESGVLAALGCVLGVVLNYGGLFMFQGTIQQKMGLSIPIGMFSQFDVIILGLVLLAGLIAGLVPAWQAYRHSLADGLTIKI